MGASTHPVTDRGARRERRHGRAGHSPGQELWWTRAAVTIQCQSVAADPPRAPAPHGHSQCQRPSASHVTAGWWLRRAVRRRVKVLMPVRRIRWGSRYLWGEGGAGPRRVSARRPQVPGPDGLGQHRQLAGHEDQGREETGQVRQGGVHACRGRSPLPRIRASGPASGRTDAGCRAGARIRPPRPVTGPGAPPGRAGSACRGCARSRASRRRRRRRRW